MVLGKNMKKIAHIDDTFRKLLKDNYGHIVSVAGKLVARSEGRGMFAGDLAHDAILRMWDGRHKAGTIRSFKAWSARVVWTTWLMRCRRLDLEKKTEKNLKKLAENGGFKHHII